MSKRFQLNREDLKKILIGAGVALAGALLTYTTEVVANLDFGDYTPIVVAGWGIVANVIRKLLAGEKTD